MTMPNPIATHRTPALALAISAAMALAGCALPVAGPGGGPTPGPGPLPPTTMPVVPKLAGSSWYWLGTMTPAGLVAPADPGAFNLEFLDGGQLVAQLDCNTGGASWKQSGRSLAIGPLKSTRKACPKASEADRFGRQLALVRGAVQSMGLLELSLGDAGAMTFARDPDWRLRNFDCPNGVPPVLVAFGRDRALVRWRDDAWEMRQQPVASGTRYAADNAILFGKGNEVTLVSDGRQVAGPCVSRR